MTTPGGPQPSSSMAEYLDRLEALIAAGPPRFPPGRRTAWEDETRQLVQQVREALSTDARRSASLGTEAEAVLRRAQDEARRIVTEAREHARRALEDGTLARAAEQQIRRLREQAVREADETRRGPTCSCVHRVGAVGTRGGPHSGHGAARQGGLERADRGPRRGRIARRGGTP